MIFFIRRIVIPACPESLGMRMIPGAVHSLKASSSGAGMTDYMFLKVRGIFWKEM